MLDLFPEFVLFRMKKIQAQRKKIRAEAENAAADYQMKMEASGCRNEQPRNILEYQDDIPILFT